MAPKTLYLTHEASEDATEISTTLKAARTNYEDRPQFASVDVGLDVVRRLFGAKTVEKLVNGEIVAVTVVLK